MTTYRAGQRVRIEWPEGSAVEGTLTKCDCCGSPILHIQHVGKADHRFWTDPSIDDDGRVITILSEPRPEEPTGIGAVVSAKQGPEQPTLRWVKARGSRNRWVNHEGDYKGFVAWDNLIDPVVLSEGWQP